MYRASAQCFRSLGPIPSGPVDLVTSRELRASSTSSWDICKSLMKDVIDEGNRSEGGRV